MSASANAWLRRRGHARVVSGARESSDEAVDEKPRASGQLITPGARSRGMPRPRISFDDVLRGDTRGGPLWERII